MPDVMVSSLFLVVLLVLYFQFAANLTSEHTGVMESLIFDADVISETMLSSGFPEGWDETTVQRPGLTDGNQRLNLTKLRRVANISYYDRKEIFGTISDYYILLQHTDASSTLLNISEEVNLTNAGLSGEGGMGQPNITLAALSSLQPEFQVRTVRYMVHNSSTIRLVIYLWRDTR